MSLAFDFLIILALFLINATLVLLVLGPLLLLQPVRRKKEWYARSTNLLEPRDAGLPQEDLLLRAPDGVHLSAWLVSRGPSARGTVFYLHGVGDCKIGGVALARFLYHQGYNVFLYDSRGHGESEGEFCTYGFYEKYDVTTAINYLHSRNDLTIGKIGVFGTSMGAAVALQAAAIEPRIAAVAAEAAFTNLRTIFVDYQRRIIKLPWHFLRNVAMVRSQRIANFKGRLVSPIDDVQRIRIPLLFIHGTRDSLIHPDYSHQLFAAAHEPKSLFLIEGADHNDVWQVGGEQYENTIRNFFATYL